MDKILKFLLGFFVCHNIVWIFKGSSSSYIYIETFIAALILFNNRASIMKEIRTTNKYIKYYVTYALILLPFSLFYFMDTSKAMSPINAIVFLSFSIILFLCIKTSRKDIHIIMRGFYTGFAFNLIYSIICYFLIQKGITWRLLDLFRLEQSNAFFYRDYYRASGFFMECSYYMCFLAITTSFILYNIRNTTQKILLICLIIVFAAISFSGNIINIFLCLILYFFIAEKQFWNPSRFFKTLIPLLILCIIFSDRIIYMLDNMDFFNLLDQSVNDINISDEDNQSNQTRMKSFMVTLEMISDNPFGYGYGCSSPLLEVKLNMKNWGVLSFLFRTLVEVGWIGLFFYLMIFVSLVTKLVKQDSGKKCIAISLICMFVAQSASGIGWMSFCVFILALADIAAKDKSFNIFINNEET